MRRALEWMRCAVLAGLTVLGLSCDMSRPQRALAPATCPQIVPAQQTARLLLDSTCNATRCGVGVAQQGCQLNLQPQECALVNGDDTWSAQIQSDGALVFERSSSYGRCAELEARSEGLISFECAQPNNGCRFDVYEPQEPLLKVERRSLLSTA